MGKALYIGDNSYKARKVKKIYIGGSDGKAHKVKKIYAKYSIFPKIIKQIPAFSLFILNFPFYFIFS